MHAGTMTAASCIELQVSERRQIMDWSLSESSTSSAGLYGVTIPTRRVGALHAKWLQLHTGMAATLILYSDDPLKICYRGFNCWPITHSQAGQELENLTPELEISILNKCSIIRNKEIFMYMQVRYSTKPRIFSVQWISLISSSPFSARDMHIIDSFHSKHLSTFFP